MIANRPVMPLHQWRGLSDRSGHAQKLFSVVPVVIVLSIWSRHFHKPRQSQQAIRTRSIEGLPSAG